MSFDSNVNLRTVEVQSLSPDRYEDFIRSVDVGFGRATAPERLERERIIFEPERAFVAVEGAEIVGTTAAQTFAITVPGGVSMPMGGIAYVTVKPSHRRRGIMRELMKRQIAEIHERGEPLAGLWASESAIYGRYGFGPAVKAGKWTLPRHAAGFAHGLREPGGRVIQLEGEAARPYLDAVYGKVRLQRTGMLTRGPQWWRFLLSDPEVFRPNATPLFHCVYFDGQEPEGYVVYRIEGPWTDRGVSIVEMLAATDDAHAALWRYCLGVDLVSHVEYWNAPVDDPLPWMLYDSRRLTRRAVDGLWLRVIEAQEALSDRPYRNRARLVLQIRDELCPWNDGAFAVDASPDGAEVRRTTESPDLVLDAWALGAAFLGGVGFRELASARFVDESRPGALLEADRLFRSAVAPWCPQEF